MTSCLNVMDFGAAGDGVTDDVPAFNAMIAQALSGGTRRCYMPTGKYRVSAPININDQLHLFGDYGTTEILPDPTVSGVNIYTERAVKLSDFTIRYPVQGQEGTQGVVVGCANVGVGKYGNALSVFRDLILVNTRVGMAFNNASVFIADNITSINHTTTGIVVQNTYWPDAGDSKIVNCYLQGGNQVPGPGVVLPYSGITWTGNGACNISHNAILNHRYGVSAFPQDPALVPGQSAMRQLFICGNTIDGCSVAAVSLFPQGNGTLGGVLINDNILNLAHYGLSVPVTPYGNWIKSLMFSNNNWHDDGQPGAILGAIDGVETFVCIGTLGEATGPSTQGWRIGNGVSGVLAVGAARGPFTVPNVLPSTLRVL